jgi:hypothetical protein
VANIVFYLPTPVINVAQLDTARRHSGAGCSHVLDDQM